MHRIARDEHQVTSLDLPGLLADSESALAFEDQHELVVIRLDVDHIFTFFENVAVFTLITNSYLLGNSIGKSPGLAPFRILST